MRIGISSRGRAWVSMGCLGWLFFGPFIAMFYLAVIAAQLLWLLLVVAPVHLVRWARREHLWQALTRSTPAFVRRPW